MPNIELPAGLTGFAVACRAMFLAYEASAVVGMGRLQARDGAAEGDLILNLVRPDAAGVGTMYADYVYGRMMKLRINYGANFVADNDRPLSLDYQSWARVYPTFDALIAAAIKSLTP